MRWTRRGLTYIEISIRIILFFSICRSYADERGDILRRGSPPTTQPKPKHSYKGTKIVGLGINVLHIKVSVTKVLKIPEGVF